MGSRDQRPSPHLCLTKQHFALRSPSANEEQASKPAWGGGGAGTRFKMSCAAF